MSIERRRFEWLEADGLGGFASGTAAGIRTRRYHALLLVAANPPADRFVLVNGVEAWVETASGPVFLTSQNYGGDVVHPDGASRIVEFVHEPWPRWTFRLPDGTLIEHDVVARHGVRAVALGWRILRAGDATPPASLTLCVRPLLSGRDYHALHHENAAFRFDPERRGDCLTWRPYDNVPDIHVLSNGDYRHDPAWYRNFSYEEESARGLDHAEDLASPGVLRFDVARGEAAMVLADGGAEAEGMLHDDATAVAGYVRACERERRESFATPLHRAADAYIVRRGAGKTLVAGYPWFTDWGRDTFIALRGLCLATGRLDDARAILLEWAGAVSEGMLPNRFPDHGEAPEFNSVDASLWYVIAVHDFLLAMRAARRRVANADSKRLHGAVKEILNGYASGTRFGIAMDDDGLLRAGEPGVQLTWMDAKVGDWVVTPRIGKPVEVQALWLNALWFGSTLAERWRRLFTLGCESFQRKFWNEAAGYLYDVVDADHVPGRNDASFRPNQIFAVGGLPISLLETKRAQRVVDAIESRLWTPLGLRSLGPQGPGYTPHYEGDVRARDGAYHQGTVWPWLTGAFVEAWLRVQGATPEAREQARSRFFAPLCAHLDDAGLGHVSEIADAEPPFAPRGCPFQAWSVGEMLRLEHGVLAIEKPAPPSALARVLRAAASAA